MKKEIAALQEKIQALERRMQPLEWDAKRNQINGFRLGQLKKLQAEHEELMQQLQNLYKESQ